MGSVCRKVVTQIAEGKEERLEISPELVREFLGRPHYYGTEEIAERTSLPGVATGLAWTPVGGDVLFIEATSMPGSKGFQLTGSLGNVMQELARAALSYVRSHAASYNLDEEVLQPFRYPPACAGRCPAQRWPIRWSDDGHRPGFAGLRLPGQGRCRHDG